jgi:uncharacterized iron-regulated protein
MRNILMLCAALMILGSLSAQKTEAFKIYNNKGKQVTFEKMASTLEKEKVILFGEYHDDPIAHWLQFKLTKHIHAKGINLVLGAEMFERDVQPILDAYLKGEITEKQFTDSTHSIWSNYSTDYRPLVEFAKANAIPFVGTNVPRPYARMVYRGGFESLDTLSALEKSYLPPLPVPYDKDLPGYKNMLEMSMGHGGDNLPKAQAIKDANMAWFTVKHLPVNGTFLHFNGSFHSNNYDGIVWYLKQYAPEITPATVTVVLQPDVSKLAEENRQLADFIIVVDADMTRTH